MRKSKEYHERRAQVIRDNDMGPPLSMSLKSLTVEDMGLPVRPGANLKNGAASGEERDGSDAPNASSVGTIGAEPNSEAFGTTTSSSGFCESAGSVPHSAADSMGKYLLSPTADDGIRGGGNVLSRVRSVWNLKSESSSGGENLKGGGGDSSSGGPGLRSRTGGRARFVSSAEEEGGEASSGIVSGETKTAEEESKIVRYKNEEGKIVEVLVEDEAVDAFIDDILKRLPPNFHAFYGEHTAYIFKAPCSARGLGLKVMTCERKLRPMLEEAYSRFALGQRWFCIAQKYLEKPFLVQYHGSLVKLDLRLWVAVVNYNPLTAIVHQAPYFRLSQKPFGFNAYKQDSQAHLTNRTIQDPSHAVRHGDPDFQWLLPDFLKYLLKTHGDQWVDRWNNTTWPLMLDAVRCALLSCQDAVVHSHAKHMRRVASRLQGAGQGPVRKGPTAFELYGMDFSLDYELRPWLLEGNIQPDLLGNSGPSLQAYGRRGLEQLLEIVVKDPRCLPVNNIPEHDVPPEIARLKCCGDPKCYTNAGVAQVQPALVTGLPVKPLGKKTDWRLFLRAPKADEEELVKGFASRKSKEWTARSTSIFSKNSGVGQNSGSFCG